MTSDRILSIARSYIGVVEKQNNNVVFNTAYYGREVNGASYPWCAVFIWYVFREAGASNLYYDGMKTAYCPELMNWFKTKTRFYSSPKVGDIAFYNFSTPRGTTAAHVGIVSEVGNGTIKAIEGNTSSVNQANGGMVMERERKLSVCLGFGRPAYDKEVATVSSTTVNYAAQVTASVLNVRTGPGTSNSIVKLDGSSMRLPKGMVIAIDKEQNGWGELAGTKYWVSLSYIKKG